VSAFLTIQDSFSDSALPCASAHMLCEVVLTFVIVSPRSSRVRPISNQSHCKIDPKRVIRKVCFALNQHEMRNVALYGFSMHEPCGLSTNSNPSFAPHSLSVTHLLGAAVHSVSNGTCSAIDQSLSYAPLRTGGMAFTTKYGRMLGSRRQRMIDDGV
jgi:hypothetical protein